MKSLRPLIGFVVFLLLLNPSSFAQLPQCSDQGTWSTYTFMNSDGHDVDIGTPLLLTNGSVMLQYTGNKVPGGNQLQDWYLLTPDINGCYGNANGCSASITELASLLNLYQNPQYAPSAMASAVLVDGKVILEGGEFNDCQCNGNRCESNPNVHCSDCVGGVGRCETTLGAIYDPLQNTWTAVAPPTDANGNPWTAIGDAPATVLPDTTFLMGNACSAQTALFNESQLSWEQSGDQQAFGSEESYTQLPNGTVAAVDTCWPGQQCMTYGNGYNSEAYDPSTKTWNSIGNTPLRLYSYGFGQANSCYDGSPVFGEQGTAALRPDGTYFATGALDQTPTFNYATHTAVYNTSTQQWQAGPDLPSVNLGSNGTYPLENEDQGGVVLPDGNVVLVAFPNGYYASNVLIEWTGSSFCQITNAPTDMDGQFDALLLPSGQVMFVLVNYYTGPKYYLYNPGGGVYPGIAPTVNQFVNAVLRRGQTYTVSGTRFGGYSSGSVFGDDFQNYTYYPIARITNDATGHVFYARTHNHSTMGVFTGDTPTYTQMDVPANMETGPSHLVVVTNSIASNAVIVNIQ